MIKRSEQNRLGESENMFVCVDDGVTCMNKRLENENEMKQVFIGLNKW